MIRKQRESTWPFLCILACLFVLSATSPRPWQRIARSKSIGEVLEESKQAGEEVVRAPAVGQPPMAELTLSTPLRRSPAVEPAEPAEPAVEMPRLVAASGAVEAEKGTRFNLPERPGGCFAQIKPGPFFGSGNLPSREVVPHVKVLEPPAEQAPRVANTPSLVNSFPPEPTLPVKDVPLPKSTPPSIEQLSKQLAGDRVSANSGTDLEQTVWEPPKKLLADLEQLADEQQTCDWVKQVSRQLEVVVSGKPDEASAAIVRLDELADQVDSRAAELGEKPLAARWRRARYALCRRLDIWKQAIAVGGWELATAESPSPDPQRLALALSKVEAAPDKSPEGLAWREFLLLDALRKLIRRPEPTDDQHRQRLARRILDRLTGNQLTLDQRRFLASKPLASLGTELHRWASKPVDLATLLRDMERFEQTDLPSNARRLAEDRQGLSLSLDDGRQQLGRLLEGHYRNANLRMAVSEDLLNRLMPIREPEHRWVRDTVLGNPIRGRSRTSTDVGIRMIADPHRLRMALEVKGQVAALTSSSSGPATFFNNSRSTYTASKPIEFSVDGVKLSPAEVKVHNNTRLRGVETDFDGLPLFGSIAKSIARSQHGQRRWEVQREVERKVARRAKQQIDTEADARFGELSKRLEQRVIRPISELSLGPEMISAQTTDRRLITRVRLADDDQLGAHTPRPRAPSSSLASLQVHQSVLNNVLEQLELDGKTFTLPELRSLIATRFNRPEMANRAAANDDVSITFAKKDPIVVHCRNGRVAIRLSVARLRKPPRPSWKNFQVRVFYRPQVAGLSVKLVRDVIIHLVGKRLSTSSQIALRGVFAKTFSKHRPWVLTPIHFCEDPRLDGLAVTQFVVDDGWVGAALGPGRTEPVPAVARR